MIFSMGVDYTTPSLRKEKERLWYGNANYWHIVWSWVFSISSVFCTYLLHALASSAASGGFFWEAFTGLLTCATPLNHRMGESIPCVFYLLPLGDSDKQSNVLLLTVVLCVCVLYDGLI